MTVGASVAAVLGTAAMATWSPVASAADDEGLAEVTVTGSRIQRRDYESNSPIVSVDAATLEERAGLNVETFLNEMPNFNPAATPVVSNQVVQMSPVNSVGIATISLRGFGANRNLVLVDGHRPVPINSMMVTDINSIPSALVERVEVISGGASAVYGADAIGGVTNFITKKNFEGMEFDAQVGINQGGDGEEVRVYSVFGTNFADNRGNVSLALEYYDRQVALEKNYRFYRRAWKDSLTGSNDLGPFGMTQVSTAAIPDPITGVAVNNSANINAIRAIFRDAPVYAADAGPGAGLQTSPCTFNTTTAALCNGSSFFITPAGTLFTQTGNNLYRYLEGGGPAIDGVEWATQQVYDNSIQPNGQIKDQLKWNQQGSMAASPQSRYSIYGSGTFDITDRIQFFVRGTWNQNRTSTILTYAGTTGGWGVTMPYNPTTDSPVDPSLNYTDQAVVTDILVNPQNYVNPNFIATGTPGAQHPVSLETAVLLNSRTNPAGNWGVGLNPLYSFDSRSTENEASVFQVETGLNFDLPIKDWTADIYYSHGESDTYTRMLGVESLSRLRVLLMQPDYGRGVTLSGNDLNTVPQGTESTQLQFGGGVVTCTSGFYDTIFKGDVRPSDDCRNAVIASLLTETKNSQDVIELNAQGGLFNTWAGEVRGAAGFQYRRNQSEFSPDILNSMSSFLDQVVGMYPLGYFNAAASVRDYYFELLVPVAQDLPFLQRAELELGGRYSDYSATDSTWTYKAVANLQFTDWLRLRGGYNRATRAPNLGEMFLSEQEIFLRSGGNFGDACSARSNSPYGAASVARDPNPVQNSAPPQLAAGQTVEGATSTYLICQAQMTLAGVQQYYGIEGDPNYPGTRATQGGGGAAWTILKGNPDLKSEKADTWTAGLVFTSVAENPWFANLTAAVDWWKVSVKDAIQQYSLDYANYLCYGTRIVSTPQEAAEQAATENCQNVARNTTSGAPTLINIAYDNQATIATSGIDVQVNWGAQLADLGATSIPGGLNVNIMFSMLDYYKTKQSALPFDVETEWKGSLGPTLVGTDPGAYSWRLNTAISYRLNPVSVSLRWRLLPSVWNADMASQKSIIANNERVAATGEGMMLTYTPSTALKAGSYNVFDLSLNWAINDTLSLRAGINNLFDVLPEITGATTGVPYDPALTLQQNIDNRSNVCTAEQRALGCQSPNGFSLPNSGLNTTNFGFYNPLGRRFFVGFKASL
jgi:outer membrane receptor protein involved in Fe transport